MHSKDIHDFALLSPVSQTSSTFSTGIDSPSASTASPTDNFIKRRHRLTSTESTYLNQMFAIDSSPNTIARQRIAKAIGMSEKAVQVWFQNKRAKMRRDETVKGPTLVYSRTKKGVGQLEGMNRSWGPLSTTSPLKNIQESSTSPVTANSTMMDMNSMHTLGIDTKHIEDWLEESTTVLNEIAALQSFQLKDNSISTFELFDEKNFDFSSWLY